MKKLDVIDIFSDKIVGELMIMETHIIGVTSYPKYISDTGKGSSEIIYEVITMGGNYCISKDNYFSLREELEQCGKILPE